MTPVQLAIGDEAWCLFTRVSGRRSASGKRATIVGAGRVRIESSLAADDAVFNCRVLRADGSNAHLVGLVRPFERGHLFATTGAEHRRFGLWLDVINRSANSDAALEELFGGEP